VSTLHQQLDSDARRSRDLDAPRLLKELDERTALAPERERELVTRAQTGDARAKAELVDAFMPLIATTARTYRATDTIQRTELIQEGVVGLLRATERYDPSKNVPFWAYASWWVRQAMQQLVAELTQPAVLSDRALRHLAKLKDAHRAALQSSGREPTRAELVERTGLTTDQVDDLLAIEQPPRSLHEQADEVGTFGELIADPLAEDEYERVLQAIETRELLDLLAGLSERERAVLQARYGLDGEERSLRDLAQKLGLSAERVRQIERRALGKLEAAAGAA
jgi:RNA polymerase sigma factor (sigma-70 family)